MHLAGYPGEKGKTPCGDLYYSSNKISDVIIRSSGKKIPLLLYQADTTAGMSGSPVWIKTANNTRQLVGVHTSFVKPGTNTSQSGNLGVPLNPLLFQQLSKGKIIYTL